MGTDMTLDADVPRTVYENSEAGRRAAIADVLARILGPARQIAGQCEALAQPRPTAAAGPVTKSTDGPSPMYHI